MYVSLAWPLPVLLIAVIVSVIVIKFRPSVGTLMLAFVGYVGVVWDVWTVVSWIFWISWIIGLIGVIAWYATRHLRAASAARGGSRFALTIVIVMTLLSLLRWFVGVITGNPNVTLVDPKVIDRHAGHLGWLALAAIVVVVVALLVRRVWMSAVAAILIIVLALLALTEVGVIGSGYQGANGNNDPVAALSTSIRSQLDKTNADVKALRGSLDDSTTAQKAVDAKQNDRLDQLEKAVAELQKHDKVQDKALAGLKADIAEIKTTGVNMTPSPKGLTTQQVADALGKSLAAHWQVGDISVGTIDWSANPFDAGSNTFGQQVTSRQEVSAFLNGSSPGSRAARQHMKEVLAAHHQPASEMQVLLSGSNFVPVQFHKKVCYFGNGLLLGDTFKRGGKICHAAGDVDWVYVASNGEVIWDASDRADCANPGSSQVPVPQEESKPRPTSSSTGTPVPSQTSTPTPSKTTKPTPTPSVCTLKPKPGYEVNSKCQYFKPVQTKNCKLNGGPGCPPNGGVQGVQHNPGQPVGKTPGAPATQPSPAPSQTAAPGGTMGDSNGTTTGTPTGTPSCDPANGCGSDHTAPPTTNIP